MTEPTKHPRTGTYRVRVTVPAHLRTITERDHGKRVEFIESLGTKSRREAAQKAPPVIAKFKAWLKAAQDEHDGHTRHLTDIEVSALCGRWLARQEELTQENIPEAVETYGERIDFLGDVLQGIEGDGSPMLNDADDFTREDVNAILSAEGLHVTHESRIRLVSRLAHVQHTHYCDLVERIRTGRWQPTAKAADFPAVPFNRGPKAAEGATLDALLAGWALDRGWKLDMKPIPRALYDRVRTVERLAEFVGHRDGSKIDRAAAVRWKSEMLGRGLTAPTVRNDMSEMSAIWKWGIANGVVTDNPFAGTLPPKASKPAKDVRGFTDEEAKAILAAAREANGYLRWLPWVLCATGARLTEIAQADREDVTVIDGVAVIRIHDEGDGRSLKNSDSRRSVPLHRDLLAEGFMSYVAELPAGSSLWPDMEPDKLFGLRSSTGGKRLARWLRETVEITDTRISPAHSWRHSFIERCRRVVMPIEVRSALTGHSAKMDESAGYGAGVGTMVQVLAEHLAKVPMPTP